MKENKILYTVVYYYVKTCLHFFYKKIMVEGLENIPKDKPIIFVANHQNAMLDPILIGSHNSRSLYFLARASVFKHKIAKKLLNAIHAIAIYRFRDGREKIKNNELVFKKCTQLLSENKCILLFPEGNHSIKRKIRPLRNGFVKLAHDLLKKYPSKELLIIPVGLNFTNTINYGESVKIIYDKPISLENYDLVNNKISATKKLLVKVKDRLKYITVHIDNEDFVLSKIPKNDFLEPKTTNSKIKLQEYVVDNKFKESFNILYFLVLLNSFVPYLLWRKIKSKVSDVEFISTFKISIAMVFFPLFYVIQAIIIGIVYNWNNALIYFVSSIVLVWICTKTK